MKRRAKAKPRVFQYQGCWFKLESGVLYKYEMTPWAGTGTRRILEELKVSRPDLIRRAAAAAVIRVTDQ